MICLSNQKQIYIYDDSFILQTPKCYTKKGMCKTGKKIYCDLKYSILEKNESKFNYCIFIVIYFKN